MAATGSVHRRGLSVRSRILASILVVAAVGLASAGAITFLVQRDRTLAAVDQRLTSRVEAARFVVTDGDESFATTREALRAVIQRVIPSGNESALGILDGTAALLPSVQLDFQLDRVPGLVSTIARETADDSVRLGTQQTAKGTYRYIAVPVRVEGDQAIGVYAVAVDLDNELAQLTAAFRTYIVVALIALVAIGLVGWFVAGRLLRPIRQLRAAALRITASDRRERIPVTGADDVSELTRTVNDMLDRLDAALTGQRQLLDDVRHELKTPITVVRGHLELLDSSLPDEVEATRALAIDELDRMSGLVDDIESLAAGSTATLAPVDVVELTADFFAKVRGIGGHEWVLVSSGEGTVPLDASRITQAWLQLADNAAKYSPEGSAIEIGSGSPSGRVEFWVRDYGPGVPSGSEARIFERFGRADAGRGIQGSGLGLAIVQTIAVAHGGRVSLETSTNGSRFAIEIPVTAAAADKAAPTKAAPQAKGHRMEDTE
jgi:signal transduction histidine kinase